MKQLLLLPAFVLGTGCCTYAQENPKPPVKLESTDSLPLAYRKIDQLDVFELKKYRESYVYKCRTEPTDRNRAILAYIEQRMQLVK